MNNFGALLALIKQQQEQQGQPMMGPDAARAGGSGATFGQAPQTMIWQRPIGPPTRQTHNFNTAPGFLKPITEPSKVFADSLLGAMGRRPDRVGSTFWENEQIPLEQLQAIQQAARERYRGSPSQLGADMEIFGEKEGLGIFDPSRQPAPEAPPAPEPADGVPYYLERPEDPRAQTAGPGQGAGFGQNVPATKALEADEGVPYYLERPVDQQAELEKERRLQTLLNGIARGGSAFGDNFISPSMIMSGLSPRGSDPSYFASGEEALDSLSDENDWRSELSKTAREQLAQLGLEVPEETSYRAAAQLFGPQLAKAQMDFDAAQALLKQQQAIEKEAKLDTKERDGLLSAQDVLLKWKAVIADKRNVNTGKWVTLLDPVAAWAGDWAESALGTKGREKLTAQLLGLKKIMQKAVEGAKASDQDFRIFNKIIGEVGDNDQLLTEKFHLMFGAFRKEMRERLLTMQREGREISAFTEGPLGELLQDETSIADTENTVDAMLGG